MTRDVQAGGANPAAVQVEPIIRGGLGRFTDMVGSLWTALADYYVRQVRAAPSALPPMGILSRPCVGLLALCCSWFSSCPASRLMRPSPRAVTERLGTRVQGNFEKARDVFEEAIQTVMTVRDFSQVFDAYAQVRPRLPAASCPWPLPVLSLPFSLFSGPAVRGIAAQYWDGGGGGRGD